jgi:phage shock protein E
MTLSIRCDEIRELVENGGQLIDVRSNHEFIQGALKDAVNMPVESIPHVAGNIDKGKPVMLYCVSGARASMVKQFLESLGFNYVYNLGGISQLAHC